ncbi:MAG: hypothetical protein ACJAXX_002152 [Roseivirga sp.]|jgi:hypothetical protein
MKKIIVFAFLICSVMLSAQNPVLEGPKLWKVLGDVKYELSKDEYGDVYLPVFNAGTKAAEGEIVEVEGFIIPLEGMFKPTQLILSSLPISECFFCGAGGPETVMEISMKEQLKFTTKRVKIRGKLKLNKTNPDKLMYLLVEGVYAGLADGSY